MQVLTQDAEQVEEITLQTGLLSDDEFWALCERYPDLNVEVSAEGEATIMAPANGWTGIRNNEISLQLGIWAKRTRTGGVCDSSAIFLLPNGARRAPDASWIAKSRIPKQPEGSWRLCPDFLIELRSETDRLSRLREKMLEWIANGAKLAWLIDPQSRKVTIYRPNRDPEILISPDSVSGEGPVEGFTLEMDEIWNSSLLEE